MLERLASLDNPTYSQIDSILEEHVSEPDTNEPRTPFVGPLRVALDSAFNHNSVEKICDDLQKMSTQHTEQDVCQWAKATLDTLEMRSPTSLKVALAAIRKGKHMTLNEVLQMELNIATAYCVCSTLCDIAMMTQTLHCNRKVPVQTSRLELKLLSWKS